MIFGSNLELTISQLIVDQTLVIISQRLLMDMINTYPAINNSSVMKRKFETTDA